MQGVGSWKRCVVPLGVLALTHIVLGVPIQRRAAICNGHAELCDRSYGNITFLGSHDSFAFSSNPLALARDQAVNITQQLDLGSLFDGGTVLSYLRIVKSFLDTHPNEVLTLLFTNPEGITVAGPWKDVFTNAGLDDLVFAPPASNIPIRRDDWPTLGSMIESGKRLVVFFDAGAAPIQNPAILPEFAMIWETPFSVTDPTFPCSVNRISGPLQVEDHMYLINHSLNVNILPVGDGVIVSDPLHADTTNSITSIEANVDLCAPLAGNRAPNFILLDFVDRGEGFAMVEKLNGFQFPPPSTEGNNTNSTSPNDGSGSNSD
ncbi:hypothetical protein ONZ45_g4017 [Pleurotus djamor]|nr:hypothetical protein ONZ45_g4017 [Pleurotus djamor]